MLKSQVPIAEEGYPFIGYAAFLTLLSAILGWPAATIILLAVTTFIILFFRDPERLAPEEDGILSPADGKIIVAETVKDVRFSDQEMVKVSIFMNVFDVHVNRVPASGTVDKVEYVPGKFIAADNDKAHLKNEYCAVTITTPEGKKLTFVQIAGLIARRIVCRLEPGDAVVRGRRFGLIRFGSRVDVYLPAETRLRVRVGEKVRAGSTVLGYIHEQI